jgi:plasmid stabilization system protein ParE
MAELIWTEPALAQLDAIADYIALDKPMVAADLVQKVFDLTDHLERFTRLGRPIPEFPQENYRQVWIKPCWIYYRAEAKRVYILHVRRAEKPLRLEDLGEA